MKLAIVLSLVAAVARAQLPDICTQAQVDASESFCRDCLTVFRCTTVDAAPVQASTCTTGKACGLIGTVKDCTDVANTDCSCTGLVCDPYNANTLDICTTDTLIGINPCDGQTCIDGACADAPPTTTTMTPPTTAAPSCSDVSTTGEFTVVTPACTTGIYCISATSDPILNPPCGEGEYFDPAGPGCAAIPPNNCAGCTNSACSHKSDCSKYVVCIDGLVSETNPCLGDTPYYDATQKKCIADNSSCDPLIACDFNTMIGTTGSSDSTGSSSDSTSSSSDSSGSSDSTGSSDSSGSSDSTGSSGDTSTAASSTTRPATCSEDNLNVNYPFEGDCSKYWSCREVSPAVYEYLERTCFGNLLFNPETGACDSADNVTCA